MFPVHGNPTVSLLESLYHRFPTHPSFTTSFQIIISTQPEPGKGKSQRD